jgi:hydroxymethylglutaryl-CoA lyase
MSVYPKAIQLIEVGPRDGLQNEKSILPTAVKVTFIKKLIAAGLKEIEVGSFVNPKWVPQMADTEAVVKALGPAPAGVTYVALVPNEKGFESALRCGIKKIAVFTAASEAFNQKNINCSIAESIARFTPVLELAKKEGVAVRGYVSTAFSCPYSGDVSSNTVADVVKKLIDLGLTDISIGDTTGKAVPTMVAQLLESLIAKHGSGRFAMHFHDTYGTALANIVESMRLGIDRFDSSAGGLGGCPYAPGASGNVATDDLVWLAERMGIQTHVGALALQAASLYIQDQLQKKLPSKQLSLLSI